VIGKSQIQADHGQTVPVTLQNQAKAPNHSETI